MTVVNRVPTIKPRQKQLSAEYLELSEAFQRFIEYQPSPAIVYEQYEGPTMLEKIRRLYERLVEKLFPL